MQKRSISFVIFMFIITVGFYELYWLVKTRNELSHTFHLSMPSAFWLVLVKAIQIGCVFFTVYAVLFAIPANNRRIDSVVRPSADCFAEYSRSSDAVRAGGKPTLSQSCSNQVEKYFQTDNTTILLLIVFVLYVVSFISLRLVLRQWLVPYAEAVAKVTRQQLSSTYAMIFLVVIPSPLGMLAIQKAYNKT